MKQKQLPKNNLRPVCCPISGETAARKVFEYNAPPEGEVGFSRAGSQPYHREVWQFSPSNHFVSCHAMTVSTDYNGDYVKATYGAEAGLQSTFERIIALPPERSDNAGRIARVSAFVERQPHFERPITLLDVGSGLGIFPWSVKNRGWHCTALDPDPSAVAHLRTGVGVDALCGDFMAMSDTKRFDIVTFNKVLEHVEDPISMLRHAQNFLSDGGFVYVELPDGEIAMHEGPQREEFFIEHLHIFSFASIVMLANKAGFSPLVVERLREPSTKYTLYAFLIKSILK